MPYTGTNPDLIDLQNQITDLQNQLNAKTASQQTQTKQVTLSLEGQLETVKAAFVTLKAYVLSKIPA